MNTNSKLVPFISKETLIDKYNYGDNMKLLGSGTYGNVYANDKYAFKVMSISTSCSLCEINALCQFVHPNIIRPIAICLNSIEFKCYIVLPLCKPFNTKYDLSDIKRIGYHLLKGLSFLHQNGFAHLDLKINNIMLLSCDKKEDTYGSNLYTTPVLIDFGLSADCEKHVKDSKVYYVFKDFAYTPVFAEPEYYNGSNSYNYAIGDIYSLGKVFECMYMDRISIGRTSPCIELSNSSPEFIDLIKKMLSRRNSRPNASELLSHPFFNDSYYDNSECYRNIPDVPSKNKNFYMTNITEDMWYILVHWILDVASHDNLDLRCLIMCLHNMHRSIHMIKNMRREHFQLWGICNMYLAVSAINRSEESINHYNRMTNNYYEESEFKSMICNIISHLNGIISTPTLWNKMTSINDAIYIVLAYCNFRFDEIVNDYNPTDIDSGMDHTSNVNLIFKDMYKYMKSIYNGINPTTLKSLSSHIKETGYKSIHFHIEKINYDSIPYMNKSCIMEYYKIGELGIIYRNIDILKNNTEYAINALQNAQSVPIETRNTLLDLFDQHMYVPSYLYRKHNKNPITTSIDEMIKLEPSLKDKIPSKL